MTAGLSVSAAAQDGAPADQVVSVYERTRPDYSAPGARTGSFLFYPTIGTSVKYDSNIFASRAGPTASIPGEIDDFIFQIKPGFNLTSDWNQNYFSVYADADIAKYGDNTGEDYEDFKVGFRGRMDISRGTSIDIGASYNDLHEDRGSPDNVGRTDAPAQYDVFRANVGFTRDLSLVSLKVAGDYENTDYDNANIIGGGIFNNNIRDREKLTGTLRLGYEVDEYYETFIRLKANSTTYDDSQSTGGPQRNSDGWEVVVGTAFDITGTSQGEVFVGYVEQNYDSNSLTNIDDFTFGASMLWNPTGLTSVRGSIARNVQETIVAQVVNGTLTPAAGILGTSFNLQVEHELQRNVLLKGTATYAKSDFVNVTRDDDTFNASLGTSYLLNRNFTLDATYSFSARNTTEAGQDFKRHIFLVGLKAKW
jgi:hypothetical protein